MIELADEIGKEHINVLLAMLEASKKYGKGPTNDVGFDLPPNAFNCFVCVDEDGYEIPSAIDSSNKQKKILDLVETSSVEQGSFEIPQGSVEGIPQMTPLASQRKRGHLLTVHETNDLYINDGSDWIFLARKHQVAGANDPEYEFVGQPPRVTVEDGSEPLVVDEKILSKLKAVGFIDGRRTKVRTIRRERRWRVETHAVNFTDRGSDFLSRKWLVMGLSRFSAVANRRITWFFAGLSVAMGFASFFTIVYKVGVCIAGWAIGVSS